MFSSQWRKATKHEIGHRQPRPCLSLTYLFGGNGLLAGLAEFLDGLGVVAQILLAADEDNWDVTAEVENLRVPLF